MDKLFDIAVIGAGAAGSMGALRGVLNNLETVCFFGSGPTKKRARATWVHKVENMPALFKYPKAISQSANEVFAWIAAHPTFAPLLTSVKDEVTKISGEKGNFVLETKQGKSFRAKYVVLCMGIMDVQPEIAGDIANVYAMANVGHIEYCIRCDGHRTKGKRTVIIGHGEGAAGIAALLKERYDCPSITILTNGKALTLPEGSVLPARLKAYGIEIKTSPIEELLGDPKVAMTGARLADGTVVPADIGFVAMGTIVYNDLAKGIGAKVDERGYVLADEAGETNISGIFVAGDLRAGKKKQIYTAWDMVVDSVDKVDSYIRAERRERMMKSPT